MTELVRPAQWGDQRFTCECHESFSEVADALRHTMAGHETGVEVYRGGRWKWDEKTTVADLMIAHWGGDPEALVRQVEAMGDFMERQAGVLN